MLYAAVFFQAGCDSADCIVLKPVVEFHDSKNSVILW
jgi:hypothetical protein